MKYAGMDVQTAVETHTADTFEDDTGGFVAVDRYGRFGIAMNTIGMFRGVFTDSEAYIAIWKDPKIRIDLSTIAIN